MKKHTRCIICILLIIVLLCASCADSGNTAKPEGITALPQYAELSSLIGLRKEDALNKMGWQDADLTEDANTFYKTPLTVEFSGISFDVLLGINPFEGRINTIVYHTEYPNQKEIAAKDILHVSNKLGGSIGKKTKKQDIEVFNMTEPQMQELLVQENLYEEILWDLTGVAETAQTEYIKLLKASESWEMYGGRQPLYGLEMAISRVNDSVFLRLNLGIFPEPLNK